MPPKKKRSAPSSYVQKQMTVLSTTMSTRSGRSAGRIILNPSKSARAEALLASATGNSAPPPPRARQATAKRGRGRPPKSKVTTIQRSSTPLVDPLDLGVTKNNSNIIEVTVVEEKNESQDMMHHPIEEIFLESLEASDMETTQILDSSTESCEIVEQLENLNVTTPVDQVEESMCKMFNDCASPVDETPSDCGGDNSAAIEDNHTDLTSRSEDVEDTFEVDYETEQFVDNSEVIIEEEVETTDSLSQVENSEDCVNMELLQPAKEISDSDDTIDHKSPMVEDNSNDTQSDPYVVLENEDANTSSQDDVVSPPIEPLEENCVEENVAPLDPVPVVEIREEDLSDLIEAVAGVAVDEREGTEEPQEEEKMAEETECDAKPCEENNFVDSDDADCIYVESTENTTIKETMVKPEQPDESDRSKTPTLPPAMTSDDQAAVIRQSPRPPPQTPPKPPKEKKIFLEDVIKMEVTKLDTRIVRPKKKSPKKDKDPPDKEKDPKESDQPKPIEPKSKKPRAPRKRPSKKKQQQKATTQDKEQQQQQQQDSQSDKEEVRRSSRIKSISVLKQRSKGHGLVKSVKPPSDVATLPPLPPETEVTTPETSNSPVISIPPTPPSETSGGSGGENRPVKVKSRWRRSSELESMNVLTPAAVVTETSGDSEKISEAQDLLEKQRQVEKELAEARGKEEVEARLKQFIHLKENLYRTDRMSCKEAKKMTCDCFLTEDEIERGEWGCGEDCLNRLLMIECGPHCPIKERCTNKKFQKSQSSPVEVFCTDKKGLGLRAAANIPYGEFILEYVGEVLNHDEFDNRADEYSKDKNRHYYFMSLRADAIIDATMKGNISRFINHSCDPNAETQKWTVNGELRIGFFSTRTILAGEEITFDYQFQRYGKEAQKCFCEAASCRGWLGEEPEDDDEEDEEEEEEEEDEEPSVKSATPEIVEKREEDATPASLEQQKEVVKLPPKKQRKKVSPRKPRKDKFEDLDRLDDEIEMLVTTGLKNQAHTLKLSRLMVRAKDPTLRAKLLRILRRGELPCRRLFLDYHGLRLMHGYMTDAQHLAKTEAKYQSLRLEMLQTLATLPIPNKTMLQDSKVLPTVEKWSKGVKDEELPMDSDSSSPQTDQDTVATTPILEEKPPIVTPPEQSTPVEEELKPHTSPVPLEEVEVKMETTEPQKPTETTYPSTKDPASTSPKDPAADINDESSATPKSESSEPNYHEEITALAVKLLEEWSNLKEVFKIPKKERIEQMKEHEREANKGYIAGLGLQENETTEKRFENRYRILKRYRSSEKPDNNSSSNRKSVKLEDRNITSFPKLGKFERRKMFALQVEQREEERRRKQREMWRQHEQQCVVLGTDPRLTAPYDPNRGYQCIWNPQIGQWQNYPVQNPSPNMMFTQPPPGHHPNNVMMPPPSANAAFSYVHHPAAAAAAALNMMSPMHPLPPLPYQEEAAAAQKKKEEEQCGQQVKFMGPIPPPAKLPAKWKCAKDKYGRPYYYHVKLRKAQWEPPPPPPPPEDESSETSSSSDTSSLSSSSSSEESDVSEDEMDDSKLIQEVRRQVDKHKTVIIPKEIPLPATPQPVPPIAHIKKEVSEGEGTPSSLEDDKPEDNHVVIKKEETEEDSPAVNEASSLNSIEGRLRDMFKETPSPPTKKRRTGLVQEIIISPRSEEDRLQFREDLKRYRMNKEKLRKEKELILQQTKKHASSEKKEKRPKTTIKIKMKEMADSNSESARKIKETFRSNMATVVVSVLNAYRKPECKEGHITNTEDFKHLARKLTHFVMLKEIKHLEKIEDLVCTESVKAKAKEYIRKYMSKFGEHYQKRSDEPDY